jgi:hypothetical protein
MWNNQVGRCAICESGLPDLLVYENRRRGYAIDHDHNTGTVRGILCTECNSVLGLAGDSPDILRRAADYLDLNGHYSRKSVVDNAWAKGRSNGCEEVKGREGDGRVQAWNASLIVR